MFHATFITYGMHVGTTKMNGTIPLLFWFVDCYYYMINFIIYL